MPNLETLDKIDRLLHQISEVTTQLFYAIPLDYKGKKYDGKTLRDLVNRIDMYLSEIADEFNIELE